MRREILRLEHVTYKEGGVTMLQDLDLNIFEGEVMGLLPIDAYGLSALIRLLSHDLPIYHGYIYYREKLVDSWLEEHSGGKRIVSIGSMSTLVEGQSILTNVMILRKGYRKEIITMGLLRKQLEIFLQEMDCPFDPSTLVEKLSPFERIAVEILRAVVSDCRLIILQEVSTVISDSEMHRLFQIIHRYTEKGFSFLYVSPHFEEHLQICDRTAMMMGRRITKILQGKEMSAQTVAYCSEEYAMRVQERLTNRSSRREGVVCCVHGLSGTYMDHLELSVRKGECLAIQCLDEKVLTELLLMLTGDGKAATEMLRLEGRPFRKKDRHKIAVVLPQPWSSMIFEKLSVYDNLCLGMDHRIPRIWSSKGIAKSIRETIEAQMGAGFMELSMQDLTIQQKSELVYTRVLFRKPKVVFCIQPFKGADLSHRLLLWEMQKRLLDREIAVVIIAVNMADALSIADRVVRIDKYSKVETYEREEFVKLPPTVPWYSLYRGMEQAGEKEKGENNVSGWN